MVSLNKGFLFCAFMLMCSPSVSQELLDGVVAIVGDEIILRSEVIQTAQAFALQMGVNPVTQPEEFENLKKSVLENLVNEKVLLAKAREDTITVDDQQVEAALEERILNLEQQLGSRERIEAYFGAPIRKLKRDYREDIKKQLIVQQVQAKKMATIQVSRREVIQFFNTMKDSLPEKKPLVKLRHILMSVKPGGEAREDAFERLRSIQDRIRQGESFEDMARAYSEDPATARRGGSLGVIERGTLFQSFEDAAFQLVPGQVSDIVETPVGIHLIQLVNKQGDGLNLRHILIRLEVSGNDESDLVEQLAEIRNRIVGGEDFGDLAREFTEDQSTKENGGDLGWLPLADFQIETFKEAVDTLETGEISIPFKTQFGYHIVRLEDKVAARPYSLEEDWDEMRAAASNMKQQRVFNEWIEEIKQNLFIEIKEDMI